MAIRELVSGVAEYLKEGRLDEDLFRRKMECDKCLGRVPSVVRLLRLSSRISCSSVNAEVAVPCQSRGMVIKK